MTRQEKISELNMRAFKYGVTSGFCLLFAAILGANQKFYDGWMANYNYAVKAGLLVFVIITAFIAMTTYVAGTRIQARINKRAQAPHKAACKRRHPASSADSRHTAKTIRQYDDVQPDYAAVLDSTWS